MFPILALLFIVVPIAELSLLIELGRIIHLWPTLAIIFTTGVVGAWLARMQGRRVLHAIRTRLSRGELPGDDLLDGLLILIAGVLLVTPGLLTDATGLLLLVPPLRGLVRVRIKRWFVRRVAGGPVVIRAVGGSPSGARGFGAPWGDGEVIDVDPVRSEERADSERGANAGRGALSEGDERERL